MCFLCCYCFSVNNDLYKGRVGYLNGRLCAKTSSIRTAVLVELRQTDGERRGWIGVVGPALAGLTKT